MLWRECEREKCVVVELTTWLLQVNAKSKSEWSAVGLGTHWRRRLLLRDPDPASEQRERDSAGAFSFQLFFCVFHSRSRPAMQCSRGLINYCYERCWLTCKLDLLLSAAAIRCVYFFIGFSRSRSLYKMAQIIAHLRITSQLL